MSSHVQVQCDNGHSFCVPIVWETGVCFLDEREEVACPKCGGWHTEDSFRVGEAHAHITRNDLLEELYLAELLAAEAGQMCKEISSEATMDAASLQLWERYSLSEKAALAEVAEWNKALSNYQGPICEAR